MKFRFIALLPILLGIGILTAFLAEAREPAIPKTVDKFTAFMADRFVDAMPNAKISVKGPLELEVSAAKDIHSVYLVNVWRFCERDRRHCRQQVDDFLSKMSSVIQEQTAERKASDIKLVVRSAAYVAEIRKAAVGHPENASLARQVAGDVWMLCVIDMPHGISPVTQGDLAKFHLTEDQAIALGLQHLAASLPPLADHTHELKKVGLKFAGGDFFESSRMLLHDDWADMAKAMGGHLVVAVPSNDVIIYGNGGGNGDRIVMGSVVQTVIERAPKPLSATLFQWTPTGWEVVKGD